MTLIVRIPSDPIIRTLWELNQLYRPEWAPKVLQWFKNNGIELRWG